MECIWQQFAMTLQKRVFRHLIGLILAAGNGCCAIVF